MMTTGYSIISELDGFKNNTYELDLAKCINSSKTNTEGLKAFKQNKPEDIVCCEGLWDTLTKIKEKAIELNKKFIDFLINIYNKIKDWTMSILGRNPKKTEIAVDNFSKDIDNAEEFAEARVHDLMSDSLETVQKDKPNIDVDELMENAVETTSGSLGLLNNYKDMSNLPEPGYLRGQSDNQALVNDYNKKAIKPITVDLPVFQNIVNKKLNVTSLYFYIFTHDTKTNLQHITEECFRDVFEIKAVSNLRFLIKVLTMYIHSVVEIITEEINDYNNSNKFTESKILHMIFERMSRPSEVFMHDLKKQPEILQSFKEHKFLSPDLKSESHINLNIDVGKVLGAFLDSDKNSKEINNYIELEVNRTNSDIEKDVKKFTSRKIQKTPLVSTAIAQKYLKDMVNVVKEESEEMKAQLKNENNLEESLKTLKKYTDDRYKFLQVVINNTCSLIKTIGKLHTIHTESVNSYLKIIDFTINIEEYTAKPRKENKFIDPKNMMNELRGKA